MKICKLSKNLSINMVKKKKIMMNIMILIIKDEVRQHSFILEESFKEFEKIYHDKIDTKSQNN